MILKTEWRGKLFFMLIAVFMLANCNEAPNKSVSNKQNMNSNHVDTVIIKQMQFNPAILIVSKGDTILWINQDVVDHDISSDVNKLFYSDTLKVGKSWKYAVTDSASYHCSIHPSMKGQIVFK
ncbi:MAG: plastocyanin/azurin family copper-binding protein [Ginsengibacter sp.]